MLEACSLQFPWGWAGQPPPQSSRSHCHPRLLHLFKHSSTRLCPQWKGHPELWVTAADSVDPQLPAHPEELGWRWSLMRSTVALYLDLLPPVEGGLAAASRRLLRLHQDKLLRETGMSLWWTWVHIRVHAFLHYNSVEKNGHSSVCGVRILKVHTTSDMFFCEDVVFHEPVMIVQVLTMNMSTRGQVLTRTNMVTWEGSHGGSIVDVLLAALNPWWTLYKNLLAFIETNVNEMNADYGQKAPSVSKS